MNQFPRLPKECREVFSAALKRDALRTMRNFKVGIKRNELGLRSLKPETEARKAAEGLKKPTFPLYGHGDEFERTSYMNMLRIKERKQGFVVSPSSEEHHSGSMALKDLWDVHEHGTIIKGRGGALIRIPPRPALRKAFNQAMKDRNMRESEKIIKAAIVLYLKTKKRSFLTKAKVHFLKGLKQYEIAG